MSDNFSYRTIAGDSTIAAPPRSRLSRIFRVIGRYPTTHVFIGLVMSYTGFFGLSSLIPDVLPFDGETATFCWFILNTLVILSLLAAMNGLASLTEAHPLALYSDFGSVAIIWDPAFIVLMGYAVPCLGLLAFTNDAEIVFLVCYFLLPIAAGFIGACFMLLYPQEEPTKPKPPPTRENRKSRRETEKKAKLAATPSAPVAVGKVRPVRSKKQEKKFQVKRLRTILEKRSKEGSADDSV